MVGLHCESFFDAWATRWDGYSSDPSLVCWPLVALLTSAAGSERLLDLGGGGSLRL